MDELTLEMNRRDVWPYSRFTRDASNKRDDRALTVTLGWRLTAVNAGSGECVNAGRRTCMPHPAAART